MKPIQSTLLAPAPHGFFTRKDGVSSGIYDSLNCGFGSDDETENVAQNREKVAKMLGLKVEHLISTHQFHSTDVITITEPTVYRPNVMADAMVTNQPKTGLGVLTADCAPVLFYDPGAQVVGAAHAGWRGALEGVIEATISAMINLGAKRDHISATIGPCIRQDAYEVGPEFVDTFVENTSDFARFFKPYPSGNAHFDLPSFVLFRLQEQGLAAATRTGNCTYTEHADFYSYRRNTHRGISDYGRQISVITLPDRP